MTHPITPPPELIARWEEDWHHSKVKHIELEDHIANEAAQWGADQELEACLKALDAVWDDPANSTVEELQRAIRAARRPKPPSLKEQALEGLTRLVSTGEFFSNQMKDLVTIRRALEALDD
jgi:hypothetical protein